MDVSGDVAGLMVKGSIQLTKGSIKLMAAGSKNLAALLWVLAKESGLVSIQEQANKGKRKYLKRLLQFMFAGFPQPFTHI